MGLLEQVAELLKSIWDADRKVRGGGILGESDFCREGGRLLAIVLAAGVAVWWWVR